MFQNGKKTIGVFISDASKEFQSRFCTGIAKRAREQGMNVAFFTCFCAYSQVEYGIGGMNINALADISRLDGIILALGTYAVSGQETEILERVRKEAHCPVVSVLNDYEDFYFVNVDETHAMDNIINHFIDVHGFTKIYFISGPKNNPVAEERLECYTRIMKEHGLWNELHTFYGDFWDYKAEEAVEYFLRGEDIPEAIVCANDSMAITACMALAKNGYRVPEDIAVTGYDDIPAAANFMPTLTTIKVPVEQEGAEAVDKIMRVLRGEKERRVSYLLTEDVYRESCGYKVRDIREMTQSRHELHKIMQMEDAHRNDNMFLSVDLQCEEASAGMMKYGLDYLRQSIYPENFFFCLSSDWKERGKMKDKTGYADIMKMVIGVMGDKTLTEITEFERKQLLPTIAITDKPMVYYFVPIHYRDNSYGYTAISFNSDRSYDSAYQPFMVNISNALENYRIRRELKSIAAELEEMYIKDVLTGIYNRRGFEMLAGKLYEEARREKKPVFLLCADVNDLKGVNDTYGHAEGDKTIAAVAGALKRAAKTGEICARVGGDEYSVIGVGVSSEEADTFARNFIEELVRYNQSNKNPYTVSASWGIQWVIPGEKDTLEKTMKYADAKMYKYKRMIKTQDHSE